MSRLDLTQVPTLEDIQLERARRTLAEFVRQAWPIVEPGMELIWNWHIDAICEHLEAVSRGEIRNLLINIPPNHCKSLLVSVFWPAWQWVHRPAWRALFGSYAMDLSLRDSVRCRDLVLSDWYRRLAPHVDLKSDQNVKGFYENTAKGFRLAIAVGGRATGFRGDAIVVDDPGSEKIFGAVSNLARISWVCPGRSTRIM